MLLLLSSKSDKALGMVVCTNVCMSPVAAMVVQDDGVGAYARLLRRGAVRMRKGRRGAAIAAHVPKGKVLLQPTHHALPTEQIRPNKMIGANCNPYPYRHDTHHTLITNHTHPHHVPRCKIIQVPPCVWTSRQTRGAIPRLACY